jgi:hypothetical protein
MVVMRTFPVKILPPAALKIKEKDLAAINGPKIRKYCETLHRLPHLRWTLTMATLGRIPSGEPVLDPGYFRLLQGWETLEKIGVSGSTTIIPFVRHKPGTNLQEFWGLPPVASPVATPVASQVASQVANPTSLPIYYTDEAPKKRKRAKTTSDSESDSEEQEEQEEEEEERNCC